MPPETPVGLFGVGLMGEVYAACLIAAGFGVIGFDIDVARMKRLVQIGGRAGFGGGNRTALRPYRDRGVLDRSGGGCR
jgi:hypothetical protein